MGYWAVFGLGSTVGGALSGLGLAVLAGLLSALPVTGRLSLATILVASLLLLDLLSPVLPLPQRATLIPQHVFNRGLARGLLRFGVEYGTGFRTRIPGAALYMCAVYLVLANHPWWVSVGAGACFGVGRSMAILQLVLLGGDGWAQFLGRHARLLERSGSLVSAALLIAAALAW